VSRNRKKKDRLRSARDLRRKSGKRPPYDRVLIVCEGEKTEPQYFEEIRKINRVPAVHVRVGAVPMMVGIRWAGLRQG
jgi:hypothetical protein